METVIYDIRCKDTARILATGPKKLNEIGEEIHKLYPGINPKGTWLRQVLVEWNPLVKKVGDKYELSDLGKVFISLPGRIGEKPTGEEKAFLTWIIMLSPKQRQVICKLLLMKDSRDQQLIRRIKESLERDNRFVVQRTGRCLKELGF